MTLSLYRKKRNFEQTPEPNGEKESSSNKLIFVVQRHDATNLHYDFRLEMDGVLKSWSVPKGPSMVFGERRLAVQVEDHPLAYAKFFGEIPEGNYGAGIVDIWDRGTYKPLEPNDKLTDEKLLLRQYRKGDLKFELSGIQLKGAFALVLMNDGTDKNWLLIKKEDKHALESYDISSIDPVKKSLKIKTVATSSPAPEDVKKAPKKKSKKDSSEGSSQKVEIESAWNKLKKPMLATAATVLKDDPDWMYEPKYDGYRAITKIKSIGESKIEMVSRNGNSFNAKYLQLISELGHFDDELILDGEIVIEGGDGTSNFQLLQNYLTTGKGKPRYYVFDLLYLNGHVITQLPFLLRRELLEGVFAKVKLLNVKTSCIIQEEGKELMKQLTKMGFEGVIEKEMNSKYFPGIRTDLWLKIKNHKSTEAVICGFTMPPKGRKFFGALILGIHDKRKLVYIGTCGTGFSEATLEQLFTQFQKLKTTKCPFSAVPKITTENGEPTWIKSKLVCNVQFLNWTAQRHLRDPVFMGLRNDKEESEVIKGNDTKPDEDN